MTLDLDRITHPLRLAKGSHERGSGKGCAMNVISYINGDIEITDYPDCSAKPLARLVQIVNDQLAGDDGYLSADDAIAVLDLGWKTVGTADVPNEVVLRWLADLLVDPQWGVVQLAGDAARTVRDLAALLLRGAEGESVSAQEWLDPIGAAAYAAAYTAVNARVDFTAWAIQRWRDLAGLDDVPVDARAVDVALAEIAP